MGSIPKYNIRDTIFQVPRYGVVFSKVPMYAVVFVMYLGMGQSLVFLMYLGMG